MNFSGHEEGKRSSNVAVAALKDLALLIGDRLSDSVTLSDQVEVVPGLGMTDDAWLLDVRANDLARNLFSVIVLGEFKNGKSTLLNAMLGSYALPAKAAPATAIITLIRSGDREEVKVWEVGQSEPKLLSREAFLNEYQLQLRDQETIQEGEGSNRFKNIEYAEIETANPVCAQSVTLIDSPGLGEHNIRTRVATNFLKRSQAAVLVLNATRILTREERVFIEDVLGTGRLPHVFFVVNRIDQIDQRDAEVLRQWLRDQLRAHFLDPDGVFDEDLYNRRVFFTNAKLGLEARVKVPPDEQMLEQSGIPAFERELEIFLTGGDRLKAAIQSSLSVVSPILDQARTRIDQTEATLAEPLQHLEQLRVEAEKRLKTLQQERQASEQTIRQYGDSIKEKVYADLRNYVDEMSNTWDEDSQRLMDLGTIVSLKNVVSAYADEEARQRMASAISEQVQKYIQAKFQIWAERIPKLVEPDIELMMAQVESELADLQLELDRIAGTFAGLPSPQEGKAGHQSADLLRVALSVSDVASLTDRALGLGDVSGFLGRMVQRSVVSSLGTAFLHSFVGERVLSVAAMVESLQGESGAKRRIRRLIGERLIPELRDQVKEQRGFIFDAIEERFRDFGSATARTTSERIESVRREQQRVVAERQDVNFSVEKEKLRLQAIKRELEGAYARLRETAGE